MEARPQRPAEFCKGIYPSHGSWILLFTFHCLSGTGWHGQVYILRHASVCVCVCVCVCVWAHMCVHTISSWLSIISSLKWGKHIVCSISPTGYRNEMRYLIKGLLKIKKNEKPLWRMTPSLSQGYQIWKYTRQKNELRVDHGAQSRRDQNPQSQAFLSGRPTRILYPGSVLPWAPVFRTHFPIHGSAIRRQKKSNTKHPASFVYLVNVPSLRQNNIFHKP